MKAKVTISRASDHLVRISIRDESSGIYFAEAALTVEAFGYAITGLAEQEAELTVRGLQWVGKQRITENRTIECPLDTYKREELARWLEANAQEDGWMIDSYLGSQGSVTRRDDVTILKYSVTKYIVPNA